MALGIMLSQERAQTLHRQQYRQCILFHLAKQVNQFDPH